MNKKLIIFAIIFTTLTSPLYALYNLSKVRLTFDGDKTKDTIRIISIDQRPFTLQISLSKWTQVDGNNILSITNDIIASPPILKLAPKQTQIIRLGLRKPITTQTELAYRLVITQLDN